ncbi:MAG: B12-binding domain-containing radical SAM protein [Candidatus Eisenbacteria bacterium]|nr:B12-binding domain-containing radical SAM protein [Candidatus Eisenbacteria bacterium]
MRSRVLLLNPPSSWYRPNPSKVIPTNLVALASFLFRHGIQSRILDLSNLVDRDNEWCGDKVDRHLGYGFGCEKPDGLEAGDCWPEFRRRLQWVADEEDIETVGVAFNWTDMRRQSLKACQMVREIIPDAKIIIGGEHASCFPERYKAMDCVDEVVVGQGEHQLLAYVTGDETWKSRPVKFSEMPMPMNWLLDDFQSYLPLIDGYRDGWYTWQNLPAGQLRSINLSGARGCPYTCGFCSTAFFYGNKVYMRSGEHIAMEMEYYHREYGVNYFRIDDDTFALNNRRIAEFADAVKRRKLHIGYECQTRVDKINDEVIRNLKESGCASLGLGIESGDEYVRTEKIGKGLKIRQRDIVANLRKLTDGGIPFSLYFIVGYFGETDASIANTVDLVSAVGPQYVSPVRMEIRPGTPAWGEAKVSYGATNDLWFDTDCPIYNSSASFRLAPFSDTQLREWMFRIRRSWVETMTTERRDQMAPTIKAVEDYYNVRLAA